MPAKARRPRLNPGNVWTDGSDRKPVLPLRVQYLREAHTMLAGMLHIPCGTFGRGHHPTEQKLADALVAAFHRGKNSRGGR